MVAGDSISAARDVRLKKSLARGEVEGPDEARDGFALCRGETQRLVV